MREVNAAGGKILDFVALLRTAGSGTNRCMGSDREVDALAKSILTACRRCRGLTVLVGIDEPRELGLYREGEDFSPPYHLVLRADFPDWSSIGQATDLASRAGGYDVAHVFEVEETAVKAAPAQRVGGRRPGVHMMHPLFFHDDLPRSALLRSWRQIHADLAVKVHVGAETYIQYLVLRRSDDAPAYGGFSDFQFPSREALLSGYFDSERGRAEIRHDIRHFIRGLQPRLFATLYQYERT